MGDYMLTVATRGDGYRDIQVNGAGDIREAIRLAERVTGAMVTHGRGGIGSLFDPAVVIDAGSGAVENRHDRQALASLEVVGADNAAAVRAAMRANRPRDPAAKSSGGAT